jgi:hypothetical protein
LVRALARPVKMAYSRRSFANARAYRNQLAIGVINAYQSPAL